MKTGGGQEVTIIPMPPRRLRLPVPRRPVRHGGQPHRGPAGPRARPLRVRASSTAASCCSASLQRREGRRRGREREDPQVRAHRPGPARRRARVLALPGPAARTDGDDAAEEAAAAPDPGRDDYPLDWLEERSGLVGGVKYFLFRKVPGDIDWYHTLGSATLTAFLVQAMTGVILAMYYKPDPDKRVRVDPAHHERPHARLARARDAPLGRERLHHPDVLPHGAASSCSARTSTRAS